MTDKTHEITPPPELVGQWVQEVYGLEGVPGSAPGKLPLHIATQAAQWGADQELEACCEWVSAISGKYGPRLRIARRPKPPSLKDQAPALINHDPANQPFLSEKGIAIIRAALEQLDD